ncbi:hypothetical protein QBL02_09840 [Leucobacter sp. UT-8R-CII-1-4]|uniref:hypothetical protein n=1 Tax=Leucobacter sp. UT-8R-CII-1-4 TaxID=3040075 RepID=UPI0024A8AFB9|nr:hypothetical protein [Leucobacter sp. UT-8R-CII-1-4]MDI6023844.1 hypothetical protein [Leucobacter sp. UT-8R-CII-1-4]
MEKKRASETGIRVEINEGENEAVAVDALVDDFLHGDMKKVLKDLHEPAGEDETSAK